MYYGKFTRGAALMIALVIAAMTVIGCGGNKPAETGDGTAAGTDAASLDPSAGTADAATGSADIAGTEKEPETATEPETAEPETTKTPETSAEPETTKTSETTMTPETTKTPEPAGHTHTYKTKTVKPTCTERGYTKYTCSGCGDTYTEYTNANGHTLEPGCTYCYDNGYTCSVCGLEVYLDIFTNKFIGEITCVSCGKKVDYTIESPTCTATGTLSYTCKSCSYKYNSSIPKTKHHGVAWTSRISDYEGVRRTTCYDCGKLLLEEKVELVPDNFDKSYWEQYIVDYATETYGLKVYFRQAPSYDLIIPADAHYAANGVLENYIKTTIDSYAKDYKITTISVWWGPFTNLVFGDEYTRYNLYIGYGDFI